MTIMTIVVVAVVVNADVDVGNFWFVQWDTFFYHRSGKVF